MVNYLVYYSGPKQNSWKRSLPIRTCLNESGKYLSPARLSVITNVSWQMVCDPTFLCSQTDTKNLLNIGRKGNLQKSLTAMQDQHAFTLFAYKNKKERGGCRACIQDKRRLCHRKDGDDAGDGDMHHAVNVLRRVMMQEVETCMYHPAKLPRRVPCVQTLHSQEAKQDRQLGSFSDFSLFVPWPLEATSCRRTKLQHPIVGRNYNLYGMHHDIIAGRNYSIQYRKMGSPDKIDLGRKENTARLTYCHQLYGCALPREQQRYLYP